MKDLFVLCMKFFMVSREITSLRGSEKNLISLEEIKRAACCRLSEDASEAGLKTHVVVVRYLTHLVRVYMIV